MHSREQAKQQERESWLREQMPVARNDIQNVANYYDTIIIILVLATAVLAFCSSQISPSLPPVPAATVFRPGPTSFWRIGDRPLPAASSSTTRGSAPRRRSLRPAVPADIPTRVLAVHPAVPPPSKAPGHLARGPLQLGRSRRRPCRPRPVDRARLSPSPRRHGRPSGASLADGLWHTGAARRVHRARRPRARPGWWRLRTRAPWWCSSTSSLLALRGEGGGDRRPAVAHARRAASSTP